MGCRCVGHGVDHLCKDDDDSETADADSPQPAGGIQGKISRECLIAISYSSVYTMIQLFYVNIVCFYLNVFKLILSFLSGGPKS